MLEGGVKKDVVWSVKKTDGNRQGECKELIRKTSSGFGALRAQFGGHFWL